MEIALLNEMTEDFAGYLSEVTDGDLTARTPCATWTIGDLYQHMLELDIQLDQDFGQRSAAPPARGDCRLRETIYRDSARRAADALTRAAASTSPDDVGTSDDRRSPRDAFEWHLTNTLIHAWDLAQALRFDFDPPRPDILDIALDRLRRMPGGMRGTGRAFAAIPEFSPGSTMAEILLLAGRSPTTREQR